MSVLLFIGCESIAIPIYYSYIRKAYATEAKTQIINIVQASELYKTETGKYPPDCWETLQEKSYLEIKRFITYRWEFICSFDEDGWSGSISATSTEEMGGCADHKVTYTKETGKITGYGQQ